MRREIALASVWMVGCAGLFAATDAPTPQADWKTMLPMVQLAVRHEFPKLAAQAHYAASITKTVDVAPGVQVALVNLGTGGYTEDMTVMRLEGATPVAAKFKGRDEKIAPKVFLLGTGEGKGDSVELVPKDHVVFTAHWETTKKNKLKCEGEAYQWDNTAKNFGYEKKLTKSMSKEFCMKVAGGPSMAAPPSVMTPAVSVVPAAPASAPGPASAAPVSQ
jgi:hypothetical protein